MEAVCKELIVTQQTQRGKGTPHSPIRIITEVFEKDGTKIAENDPSPELFTTIDLIHFARFCADNNFGSETSIEITVHTVEKWRLDTI